MKEIIQNLISLKQEGGYWDFKREWYSESKKTDMLHDIICFANNLEDRDAYIIVGIDEEKYFQLNDVTKDQNRKTTQNIVDWMRNMPFSGGTRPIVYVETINYKDGYLDIIVIKNSKYTPYFLTKRVTGVGVHPNNIYTRIQDTNTPIDSSADIDKIEYLWKKRFGLLQSPLEKYEIYIEDFENWIDSAQGEMNKYYKHFPEYTIDYRNDSDGRKGYEYYFFSQMDSRPRYHDIIIRYHQVILYERLGASLDGGRYFTPTPDIDFISFKENYDKKIALRFYVKGTFLHNLQQFFLKNEWSDEAQYSHNSFMKVILLFESETEKENFKKYIVANESLVNKYLNELDSSHYTENVDGYKDYAFENDYRIALVMKKMLSDFRKN